MPKQLRRIFISLVIVMLLTVGALVYWQVSGKPVPIFFIPLYLIGYVIAAGFIISVLAQVVRSWFRSDSSETSLETRTTPVWLEATSRGTGSEAGGRVISKVSRVFLHVIGLLLFCLMFAGLNLSHYRERLVLNHRPMSPDVRAGYVHRVQVKGLVRYLDGHDLLFFHWLFPGSFLAGIAGGLIFRKLGYADPSQAARRYPG